MRKIVAAATKIGVVEEGFDYVSKEIILVGVRHWDDLMHNQYNNMPESVTVDEVQGFVDNFGQFLTREEAWVVAESAGQILFKESWNVNSKGNYVLYSENVW